MTSAPGQQGVICETTEGSVGERKRDCKRDAQRTTRTEAKSKKEGGDVRDSRDIQSLIAMSRCRKEPEQAFQVAMTREGRS